MGEEISRTAFDPEDFERFDARLRAETALLREWADGGRLSGQGHTFGFELECWLLDHACTPTPINEAFLATLAHPLVVPELSRFNVELNSEPLALSGDAFARARRELERLWGYCNRVAHGLDANMVAIGMLPTIRDEDLSIANISPLKRYDALNHEVLRRRGGRPIRVDIAGEDPLIVEHHDVMLEAATTSFQVHLKVPAGLAHRYLNASALASAPLLAVSANAPLLFGRRLWAETRIPLFEQAIDLPGHRAGSRRVTFGEGWLRASAVEVFEQNLADYPVLLPLCFDDPPDRLRHLRLHNGTIWRWNRPLVGFEPDGTPHLRIEFRCLPAGPSLLDMMANAAFYVGLVHDLVRAEPDETLGLAFEAARANFYRAARDGPSADLMWQGGASLRAGVLVERLLSRAARGLAAFGVDAGDASALLGVLAERAHSGRTGSAWLRAAWARTDGDADRVMATYCERQRSGAPVAQWDP
jgi:hypothetical protein